MTAYRSELDRVIRDVVEPSVSSVDREAQFPRKGIDALAGAGILGLACAKEVGGAGIGHRNAAGVIERLAAVCGSTAMVVLMHYAATAAIEKYGSDHVRREIAQGRHLSTLAFSEVGSPSHFWAPLGTATMSASPRARLASPEQPVRLDARKSWVTSAGEADSYVWSSLPLSSSSGMTLWLVPAMCPKLYIGKPFDGMGLRGNSSLPITADGVLVPQTSRLGADGVGMDIALSVVLPWFLVLSAAFSLGLMEATVAETVAHVGGTRLEHLGQTLSEQPVTRLDVARMRMTTDATRALVDDTLTALEQKRADAMLRLLEVKAFAAEAAITVTDLAMKICGGAAFRKEIAIERRFRDARATRVMAPTTDALLDFTGRVTCGQPLFDGAA